MKDTKLIFKKGYIHTEDPYTEVMGDWELPIMEKHVEICCQKGGDILEVGFGMGISANIIQQYDIKSHTIVELHPQIINRLKEWSKGKKNINIIEGDWYDSLNIINSRKYDGIFFDTHLDPNRKKFRELVVDKSLKDNGIFTYFKIGRTDFYNYFDKLKIETVSCKTDSNSRVGENDNFLVEIPYYINI
jgi:spermidine synthase